MTTIDGWTVDGYKAARGDSEARAYDDCIEVEGDVNTTAVPLSVLRAILEAAGWSIMAPGEGEHPDAPECGTLRPLTPEALELERAGAIGRARVLLEAAGLMVTDRSQHPVLDWLSNERVAFREQRDAARAEVARLRALCAKASRGEACEEELEAAGKGET